MGFDIVVIKPRRVLDSLTSWKKDDVADPLGTPAEMREHCLKAFPGTRWSSERNGLYLQQEDYAVEFSIPTETNPTSLHLTLRTGPSWNDGTDMGFHAKVSELYNNAGWQAFAVSDNSALLPLTERSNDHEAKE